MSFFHHPSGVGKLRIGDVVSTLAKRADIDLTDIITIESDVKLAIGCSHAKIPCVSGKKAVCNLKTLEDLAWLVGLCITCPVDVYDFVLSVQLHSHE